MTGEEGDIKMAHVPSIYFYNHEGNRDMHKNL